MHIQENKMKCCIGGDKQHPTFHTILQICPTLIMFIGNKICLQHGERTSAPPDNSPPDNCPPGQQQPRTRTIPPPYIYTYTNVNSVSVIELNNYWTISVD